MVARKKELLLQEIIAQARDRKFGYAAREKTKTNWRAYDEAQCREIASMLDFIRELVDVAEERVAARNASKKKAAALGRPIEVPASDVVKVLLMQTYFNAPNRVASGLQTLFSDRLGLRTEFSYKTIERGYDDGDVRELLEEVNALTNEPVKGLEKVFSVDGTGHATSSKQNYESDRSKQRRENDGVCANAFPDSVRPYVANVAVIGVKYKLYAASASTVNARVGERSLFNDVFEDAVALHPGMEKMLGDGLYANRPTCKTVSAAGVLPVFLPARNVTMKKKGVAAWVRMLARIVDSPQEFLRDYHERSISESGFSMDARAFPKPVLKRLPERKVTASRLRFVCHNVKRLCYIKFLCSEVKLVFSNRVSEAS